MQPHQKYFPLCFLCLEYGGPTLSKDNRETAFCKHTINRVSVSEIRNERWVPLRITLNPESAWLCEGSCLPGLSHMAASACPVPSTYIYIHIYVWP